MGFVLIVIAMIGFVIGLPFGVGGYIWYRRQNKRRNGDCTKTFRNSSTIGFLAIAIIGGFIFPIGGHSPPSGQDYNNLSIVFFMIGAAPGFSLLIGAVMVFNTSPPHIDIYRRTDSSSSTVESSTQINNTKYADNFEWSLELIQSLGSKSFGKLCVAYFQEEGFKVEVTRTDTEGGVDLLLYKDKHSLASPMGVVHCKAWKENEVGIKPVRELFRVIPAENATLGIFITSGLYTEEAVKFSKDKDLVLFTGDFLLKEIISLPPENQERLLKTIRND